MVTRILGWGLFQFMWLPNLLKFIPHRCKKPSSFPSFPISSFCKRLAHRTSTVVTASFWLGPSKDANAGRTKVIWFGWKWPQKQVLQQEKIESRNKNSQTNVLYKLQCSNAPCNIYLHYWPMKHLGCWKPIHFVKQCANQHRPSDWHSPQWPDTTCKRRAAGSLLAIFMGEF